MQNEDVTTLVWQDKRVVLLLSTNSDPRADVSVTRKTGKGNKEFKNTCPQAAANYTKHVGGVYVSDLKPEYCGVGRSSKNCENLYYIMPKCVSYELFHLIRSDKSSPLYSTRKPVTDLQTKLGASAD